MTRARMDSNQNLSRLFYQSSNSSKHEHLVVIPYVDFEFMPHLHRDLEFVMVLEGEMAYATPYCKAVMKEGDIALFLPNQIHSFCTPTHSRCVIVNFSVGYVSAFLRKINGKIGAKCHYHAGEALINYLIDLYVRQSKDQLDYLTVKASCYAVCARYAQDIELIAAPEDNGDVLHRILTYVNENYTENISLKSMSAAIGYNEDYLSHFFRKTLGLAFRAYVNLLRIDHACQLIEQGELSISNIALACGFQNIRSFNRAFKQIMEETPMNYKKQNRHGGIGLADQSS